MDTRRGEPNKLWFRADRFFAEDNLWYFQTREGIAVGPYDSRFEAVMEARRLVQMLEHENDPIRAVAIIHEFVNRPRVQPRDSYG